MWRWRPDSNRRIDLIPQFRPVRSLVSPCLFRFPRGLLRPRSRIIHPLSVRYCPGARNAWDSNFGTRRGPQLLWRHALTLLRASSSTRPSNLRSCFPPYVLSAALAGALLLLFSLTVGTGCGGYSSDGTQRCHCNKEGGKCHICTPSLGCPPEIKGVGSNRCTTM